MINLIPLEDIKILFNQYNIRLGKDKNEKLKELILSNRIEEAPDSIVDFIIAYNLLINKVKIPIYQRSEILLASKQELKIIAQTLQTDFIDKNSIIRILTYLDKLDDDLSSLSEETILIILNDLPCRDLISLSKTNNRLAQIINSYNLINIAKYKNFPRKDGHCHSYDVSQYYKENFKIRSTSKSYEIFNIEELYSNYLDKILDHLYQINIDLVRGDLILTINSDYRNEGVYIFDGCQIVSLDYKLDDYGALPKEFKVINFNTPIDYWFDGKIRGIRHNGIIWFDSTSVRDQLIKNIKVEEIGEYGNKITEEISTTFIYNNVKYTILYNAENPNVYKFINILKTKDVLMFDDGENQDYYKNNILILPNQ